jgi:hypothetical protein
MNPHQIICEVALKHGVGSTEVTSQCRSDRVVRARIEIAHELSALGFSPSRIGMMLNKDRSTIVFYLGRTKREPSIKLQRRPPKVRVVKRKRYLIPYAGAYWPEYDWKERPCGSEA